MAAGTPLTDDDRWPWLDRLAAEMAAIDGAARHAVLACSALKQAYRDRISRAGDVRFVHLAGDHDTIAARLAARKHHYMPPSLLASQFATLEAPADALVVDVRDAVRGAGREDPRRIELTGRMSDDERKPATRAAISGATPASFWAPSTRRSFARRRCSFRPSPSSSRRRAANTRASATACTACRPSPICRTRSPRSKARTPRSRCRRGSPRRRCRCSRS